MSSFMHKALILSLMEVVLSINICAILIADSERTKVFSECIDYCICVSRVHCVYLLYSGRLMAAVV